MLLALGLVAVVGLGAVALTRPRAPGSSAGTDPGAKPISTQTAPPGAGPKGESLPPPRGGGSDEALKYASTGIGAVGAVLGIVKAAVGVGGATAAGTAGATAGGGTAAGGGAAGGVSLTVVAAWAIAIYAVVGFVVGSVLQLVSDLDRLRHGPAGYVAELTKLCHETAAGLETRLRKPKADGGFGLSEVKARALARLLAWDVVVGFNRAAWAYLKYGAARESINGVGVSVLGITPEIRHENFWIARGYALPDVVGLMYESAAPVPPKPANWPSDKRWPPLPPVMGDLQWTQTPEWFAFQGLNTTRAQCLQDAGGDYTEELRQVADFIGRASRCSYSLHNKLGPSGQGVAVLDTAGAVLFYVNCGMIGGLQPPPNFGVPHAHDTGLICFDNRTGSPCVHDASLNLGWFFNESITDVPVRPYR